MITKISLLFLWIFLSIPAVMAASQLILDTDKDSYQVGELVKVRGTLSNTGDGFPVAVGVTNSQNNPILLRTIQTDSDGNFQLEFKLSPGENSDSLTITANAEVGGTIVSDTKEIKIETKSEQGSSDETKSGCLIATAAYGSELAPQVQMLREIRDNMLLQTKSGTSFMTTFNQFYYTFSPTVADWERQNIIFKETVKLAITPLITTLSILNYLDINSEAEMIAYGMGIILLNVGMYFVTPSIVIWKIRKNSM